MSMDTCTFLGIYPEYIEKASKTCEDAMERLGFSVSEIDDMNDYAKQEIDENRGGMDGITNRIISAYYSVTACMIHEKFPNLRVDYDVDGYCSFFDVDEPEKMTEDEEEK